MLGQNVVSNGPLRRAFSLRLAPKGGGFPGSVSFAAMWILGRHALVWIFLVAPAAAKPPSQIPSEAEARKAYYNCLHVFIADKSESDVASDQLVAAAELTCEYEYDQLLLGILGRPDFAKMTDKPLTLAKDIREDFGKQARSEMMRIISEARRHRPKPK